MIIASSCPCCEFKQINKSNAILMPFMAKMIFDYDLCEIDNQWKLYGVDNGKLYMPCKSVQCQNCGFLFSDFRFDDNELNNLYKNYRESVYVSTREFFEPGYTNKQITIDEKIKYKKDIEFFLDMVCNKPIILDWGGDDGKNTPFLDNANKIYIYEFSNKILYPNCFKINENELYNHQYDLVVCSNVLEHVSFPKDLLKAILKTMNENSILYIELPYENLMIENENNYKIHHAKKHWHEHINFFTIKSLHILLKSVGLKIVKEQIFKYEESAKHVSFQNLFMIACKLDGLSK